MNHSRRSRKPTLHDRLDHLFYLSWKRHEKLKERLRNIMTTVAEVSAKLDAAMAKLTANTDALKGISDYIAAVRVELAAVKKQLQDLIDAGNNPPELTEVVAKLDALDAGLDAQAVKQAAVTGTPDDPND